MAVQVVERWILARLRHRRFFSLVELNTAIRQLRGQMNDRPLQRHKVSRRELFETLDKPVLRPLPPTPYEYAQWKKAKVGIDYHIEFDGRLYSVPHNLVGQAVELRISATVISVPLTVVRHQLENRPHPPGSGLVLSPGLPFVPQ
uniref:Transposase for insertion sequence element IS21-like C-terminal domain-containing protein n=1 Tax=Candidatus Kentrum sp. LPFa TaxID=2126335 RepID=A0A450WNU6_9GAMM|nr:MAG: hypothetical protein BECKLPF1236A_GA0070988_102047 [Candidatus Kentron sp. LPFa]VFK33270.1 MAG: hypothetical protein BECKLPF1236C_GA0070990_101998 [Candidatus Kentron sp. LPFa]